MKKIYLTNFYKTVFLEGKFVIFHQRTILILCLITNINSFFKYFFSKKNKNFIQNPRDHGLLILVLLLHSSSTFICFQCLYKH